MRMSCCQGHFFFHCLSALLWTRICKWNSSRTQMAPRSAVCVKRACSLQLDNVTQTTSTSLGLCHNWYCGSCCPETLDRYRSRINIPYVSAMQMLTVNRHPESMSSSLLCLFIGISISPLWLHLDSIFYLASIFLETVQLKALWCESKTGDESIWLFISRLFRSFFCTAMYDINPVFLLHVLCIHMCNRFLSLFVFFFFFCCHIFCWRASHQAG